MAMAEPAEYGLAYLAQFGSADELWAAHADGREKFRGTIDRIDVFWEGFDWKQNGAGAASLSLPRSREENLAMTVYHATLGAMGELIAVYLTAHAPTYCTHETALAARGVHPTFRRCAMALRGPAGTWPRFDRTSSSSTPAIWSPSFRRSSTAPRATEAC